MNVKKSTQVYLLKSSKFGDDQKVERPVSIRVSFKGKSVTVPAGISVSFRSWDAETKRMLPGKTTSKGLSSVQVNREIEKMLDAIDAVFKRYEVQEHVPVPSQVHDDILKKAGKTVKGDASYADKSEFVDDAIAAYIECNGAEKAWSIGSIKVFNTLRHDLASFKKGLKFSHLNEKGLAQFLEWLRFTKPRRTLSRMGDEIEEIGIKDTTILKRISTLRMFLRWADRQGYPVHRAYIDFKPRIRSTHNSVVFLTPEEIQKIQAFDIPASRQSLVRVRDVLVFLCYTGLRFSDVKNLKKSDLRDTYLEVTTVKTADSLRIEFNNISKSILDKYAFMNLPDNMALPVVSNQKMNKLIKELGQMAGIDTPIRRTLYKGSERRDVVLAKYMCLETHTGRRSFICNGLAKGIPVHVMMKWTGHSSYASMKPYIDAVQSVTKAEMQKFNLDAQLPSNKYARISVTEQGKEENVSYYSTSSRSNN